MSDRQGVNVTIAPYTNAKSEDRALVLLQGIHGDWDGKVLDTAVIPSARDGADYQIQYKGGPYYVINYRPDSGYQLFFPGGSHDGIWLSKDPELAENSTPQSMLQLYQSQPSGKK